MRNQDLMYLSNHHVAVKCPSTGRLGWPVDVRPNLCHDRGSECDIWYEMAIPVYCWSAWLRPYSDKSAASIRGRAAALLT